MKDPTEKLKKLQEQARQRSGGTASKQDESLGQQLLFPEWADSKRAAPSAAFRSALFPALGRQPRRWLKDEPIFSTGGVTVKFRGEQLDQTDLDVYLEILHLMRDQPESTNFTAHGLLKILGRSTGKHDYEWLHAAIIRLTAGTVLIHDHGRKYFGHLVMDGVFDEKTKHYVIRCNPKFARMFSASWSTLDVSQRRELRSDTAKSLHAYYSSHRRPGLHRYDTLADIAGLIGKNRKSTLLRAHGELVDSGFLIDWEATKEGIIVQMANLERKPKKISNDQTPAGPTRDSEGKNSG